MHPTSHRAGSSKFVKIDLKHRKTNAKAIVTCSKAEMPAKISEYQDRGYELINVTQTR